MVLTTRRKAPLAPTLIVPDEQTWTLSGTDPASRGLRPVFALGQAERLLVPEALPGPLTEALRSVLAQLPIGIEIQTLVLPRVHGESTGTAPYEAHAGEHDQHAGHGTYGWDHDMGGDHHHMGGDHHDMMAIVGEPSADGLVMEPIQLGFGRLGTPLPGGLALDVTLDGDVVAESSVEALLGSRASGDEPPLPPDLLAPVAWTFAIESAHGERTGVFPWARVAALEAERAVSHLAWLRAFARVLGWQLLVDRCTAALDGLPPLAHELVQWQNERRERDEPAALAVLERASARADGVAALVRGSRSLRLRTAGLGAVTPEYLERVGLRGPVARAAGLRDDTRAGHPLYELLGFEPVAESGGDAHARTLVRAEEVRRSLRLACAALQAGVDGKSTAAAFAGPGQAVEGPRGPLHAEQRADGWRLDAPGSQAALRTAGEAMVDAEWAASLVALASFDLSPWRVGT